MQLKVKNGVNNISSAIKSVSSPGSISNPTSLNPAKRRAAAEFSPITEAEKAEMMEVMRGVYPRWQIFVSRDPDPEIKIVKNEKGEIIAENFLDKIDEEGVHYEDPFVEVIKDSSSEEPCQEALVPQSLFSRVMSYFPRFSK